MAMLWSPTPSPLPPCPRMHAEGEDLPSVKHCCSLFSCLYFHIHLPSPQRSPSPSPLHPDRPIFAAETHVPARSCRPEGGSWQRGGCVPPVPHGGCSSIMIPSCFPAFILWERSWHHSVQDWVYPRDTGLISGGMGE